MEVGISHLWCDNSGAGIYRLRRDNSGDIIPTESRPKRDSETLSDIFNSHSETINIHKVKTFRRSI